MKLTQNIDHLEGLKVRVYRNLTKKCFSVKCKKTNRVIAHVDDITLRDVTFPVSKAGRERVLRERQKNVHAFIEGVVDREKMVYGNTAICYNPYKRDHFFYCSNGREIKRANYVLIDLQGVLAM